MNIAFANPSILWALSLISVPILLHLFNLQKPQVVYFSSIRFLKQLETESQKTSTLKRWILLLMRILAVCCIVLAFAKPYLPDRSASNIASAGAKYIYIDNSFSMSAQSEKGTCLEHAKMIATSIVANGGKNERYWIADNDRIYAGQDPTDAVRSIEAISNITTSGTVKKITEIAEKALWKTNAQSVELIAITDAQKISCNVSELHDSTVFTMLIPIIPVNNGNISIDSCWLETPYRKSGSLEKIFVGVTKRNKDEQNDMTLKLFVNDSLKAVSNHEITGESTIINIEYTNPLSGEVNIRLEIEDYPIEWDNKYHYSYMIAAEIPVLYLYQHKANPAVSAMYEGQAEIQFESVRSDMVSPSDIENNSLVITEDQNALSEGIQSALREFVHKGGSLMIIPSPPSADNQKKHLSELFGIRRDSTGTVAEINHIESSEEVFAAAIKTKNKNKPAITVNSPHYFTIPQSLRYRSLLSFSNNKTAFAQINYGSGKLYISAAPIDRSNSSFIGHPIIAPLLFNPALFSRASHSSQTFIGNESSVRMEEFANQNLKIISASGDVDFVPEYRYDRFNSRLHIMPSDNIKKDGLYRLVTDVASLPLAFNYSREESNAELFTIDQLNEFIDNGARFAIEEPQDNTDYQFARLHNENAWMWAYLFIAGIVFLCTELLIIKLL